MGYYRHKDIINYNHSITYVAPQKERWLFRKLRKDSLLKFYKAVTVPEILYGSELWGLNGQAMERVVAAEMEFFRLLAYYLIYYLQMGRGISHLW